MKHKKLGVIKIIYKSIICFSKKPCILNSLYFLYKVNRVPELSIEETFHLAQPRISSVRRQSRRTWNFRKCLCCTLPIDEEVVTFYLLYRYRTREERRRHIHRYMLVHRLYHMRNYRLHKHVYQIIGDISFHW